MLLPRKAPASPVAALLLPRRRFLRKASLAMTLGTGTVAAGVLGGLPVLPWRTALASAGDAISDQSTIPAPAAAAMLPDWPVPDGHFYTQMAPPGSPPDTGYVVANSDGINLWRDYQALGGPAQLGFPLSRRYDAGGIVYQVMQSGVLRWNATLSGADLFPVYLAFVELQLDEWLESLGIPVTASALLENPQLPAEQRLSWLTHPRLRDVFAAPDFATGVARFGLPMSLPQRFGPYLAQRFDKAVLQLWLDNVPGQPAAGMVTLAPVGHLLRDAELIPAAALVPEPAPAPRPVPAPPTLATAPEPLLPSTAPAQLVPAPRLTSGKLVVVSLGQQWWFAFQDGQLLNHGPVTTGRPELPTPPGRFTIFNKFTPYTMYSPWPRGSPFWYEPSSMTFAMQITGNGVFLHDAPWRPFYGPGTNLPHIGPDGIWRTGSHGCINMTYGGAAWLFRWAPLGTPVDVVA